MTPAPGGRPLTPGVIGVIRDDASRILLCERAAGVRNPGLWCFPGGHVEPGESPGDAIVRELREELDILVDPGRHLGAVLMPHSHYRLEVFAVEWRDGEIRPNPAEIAAAEFLSPDDALRLARPMPSNSRVFDLLRRARLMP